jgi:septum formation protein
VLASGSSARASVLRGAGIEFEVDRPEVDERAHDDLLASDGPAALALHLARLKAAAVVGRHPAALVLAADQVGVLDVDGEIVLLVQQPTFEGAVQQLLSMSGSTHLLVNGLVLTDTASGRQVSGVDVQTVTMRSFDRTAAEAYVAQFEPYESAGSYRLEDQGEMRPEDRLVVGVAGEDPSGVLGLPLPLFQRMCDQLEGDGSA